jgi:hypothetical protein
MFLGVGLQKHPINGSKKFLFLSNKSTKSRVSQIHLFRDLFKLFSFAFLILFIRIFTPWQWQIHKTLTLYSKLKIASLL